jgi:hypothetical protein
MCDRPDIRNKRLEISFREMSREETAPSTFAEHKLASPRLAPAACTGLESFKHLFTALLPVKLRQCKHTIVQTTVRQQRDNIKFRRSIFLTNINALKCQLIAEFQFIW